MQWGGGVLVLLAGAVSAGHMLPLLAPPYLWEPSRIPLACPPHNQAHYMCSNTAAVTILSFFLCWVVPRQLR